MSKHKPSNWHFVKGQWFVCSTHCKILYERICCNDGKTWRHQGPFTGSSCESAGPFKTREMAERWMAKNEMEEVEF